MVSQFWYGRFAIFLSLHVSKRFYVSIISDRLFRPRQLHISVAIFQLQLLWIKLQLVRESNNNSKSKTPWQIVPSMWPVRVNDEVNQKWKLEGAQRVHITAKYTIMLWCTRLHVYVRASLVMNVCSRRLPTIISSSIMTACSGVCKKSIGNGVNIFVHFSSTPTSILNLTISSESQYNDVSSDISSVWKYSQLFTHESNTFLAKIRHSTYYASHNSLLPRATKPKHRTDTVYIFVHFSFSSNPFSILNLTTSSESQENDVFNDVLSVRKYS